MYLNEYIFVYIISNITLNECLYIFVFIISFVYSVEMTFPLPYIICFYIIEYKIKR